MADGRQIELTGQLMIAVLAGALLVFSLGWFLGARGLDSADETAAVQATDPVAMQTPPGDGAPGQAETPRAVPRPPAPTEVRRVDVRQTDPVRGASSENALVTIVEFSSFQCPFSSRASAVLDQIHRRYSDRVRHVFKHFPLSSQVHSEPAARASMAALNQGQFWPYQSLLYANQQRLGEAGVFEELAAELSLDMVRFQTDFQAAETAELVRQAQAEARQAGVNGTPDFLINGIRVVGAQPLATFERYIKEQIEIAEQIRAERGLVGDELHIAMVEHNRNQLSPPGGELASQPEAQPTPTAAAPPRVVDAARLTVGDAYTRGGGEDAPVTIFGFSSFQCGFCARGSQVLKRVADTYGDQVRIVFKNFPLDFQAQSEQAARAALAAGEQGRFWPMYEKLYANQRELAQEGVFERLAQELDLDLERFVEDMNSEALRAQVEADAALGRSLGVRGTPTYFVNGEILSGAQPFERFKAIIDRELEKS